MSELLHVPKEKIGSLRDEMTFLGSHNESVADYKDSYFKTYISRAAHFPRF